MTNEKHIKQIGQEFYKLMSEKYRKGAKEHGGRLWQKTNMLEEAINESIDLIVYLLTLKNYGGLETKRDRLCGQKKKGRMANNRYCQKTQKKS